MTDHDRTDVALLLAGVGLGALGQFYFTYRREYVWDGLLFWGAGILLLAVILRRALRSERGHGRAAGLGSRWLSAVRDHPARAVVAAVGMGLSVAAGWWARQRPPSAGFADLLAEWSVGTTSFLLAFLPSVSWSRELRRSAMIRGRLGHWLRDNRLEVAGLVILVVASLVVRGYDLERIPANLGGDEGTQAAAGLQLMRAPLGNPFSTGWYSVPTMSLLAYGVSMRVFGATVSGLRALSALIGTATVLATFLLARELWDRRVAWVSAGLLAFGHYHIHFSRLGSNQVADPLFAALALWLVARALRTRRFFAFAATGAVVGLGWYGYFGARLVGVVVACYLGLQAVLRRKFLERYGLHVTILLASALVVAAPLLLHYLAHPGELVSRPRQVNIFASEWLARERVITGRSTLSLLLEQFWKSISAFNYTLDPTFWYRASIPLLDIITGLLFVVGLLWTLGHRRRAASQLLLLWFWLALILGWVVTENPPSSQRMVIIAPALALLAGLGLDWVLQVVEPLFAGRGALASGVAAVVVGAAAGVNLHYYFLEYTSTRVYGNPTAEMTTVLARQLTEEDDDRRVYLHGAPHVYWEFGTLRFLARGIEGEDVPPPDGGEAVGLDVSQGARFIFHPERLNELKDVRGRFPGGEATYVHSSADGELLYAMYELGA